MNAESDVKTLGLPVEEWCEAMKAAVEHICGLGGRILEIHGAAVEASVEISEEWKLAERQACEQKALQDIFDCLKGFLITLEKVRSSADPVLQKEAALLINQNLPVIEDSFVVIRHAALDLLRWVRRFAQMEESSLPAEYRAGYADFVAFAPVFKPWLESYQQELLGASRSEEADPAVLELLTAVSRLNGVLDMARGFVSAIVEPPLDLVFQDTNIFMEDWQTFSEDIRRGFVSELNDTCQFLLYDKAEFRKRTGKIRPQLADGIDASLYSLLVGDTRILFSVDEDPMFGQLTVTLYRAVHKDEFNKACEMVIKSLYRELI